MTGNWRKLHVRDVTHPSFVTVQNTPPDTRSTSTKTAMLSCLSPFFLFPMRNQSPAALVGHIVLLRLRRRCGSSVPRASTQNGHQKGNGRCHGSMLCDHVICGISWSSLHSRSTEFGWQVGSCFFLSWSAGNKTTVSAAGNQQHVQRRNVMVYPGYRHGTESVNCQKELSAFFFPASSDVHQSECALHTWRVRPRNPAPSSL